jgi:hypothetical protein
MTDHPMNPTVRLLGFCGLLLALLSGCAHTPPEPYDYSHFKASNPRSILVLPPVNKTPDVRASHSMLAQVTHPLAESGYYVLPVSLVNETLRENGVTEPAIAHGLPTAKLREIFGADAVLYMDITAYGTVYQVLNSHSTVTANARLVDLKTNRLLWEGRASASTAEQQNQQQGLLAMVINAAIQQIANTITEKSHEMAGITSQRLLRAGGPRDLLYGPRSPHHEQQRATLAK